MVTNAAPIVISCAGEIVGVSLLVTAGKDRRYCANLFRLDITHIIVCA